MISSTPHPKQQGWNAHSNTGQGQPVNPNTFQYPGQEFPTEEPKKKRRKRSTAEKVGSAIAAVVLIGTTGYSIWQSSSASRALKPGNCVVTTGEDDSIDVKEVSCDDKTQASLKVIKSLPEGKVSCGKDYTVTIWRDTDSKPSPKRTYYCLQLNLHVDVCYKIVNNKDLQIAECGTSEAEFKVAKQLPREDASCESDQQPLQLPGTGVTSCIVAEN